MENILKINNIEVVYNKAVQVLRGLSLTVPKGAIVALLGSNGAGKSTVLKSVSGLLKLEDGEVVEGEISFKDRSVALDSPDKLVHRGLFHMMEGRHIFEDLTVEENLIAATYACKGRKSKTNTFDLVYEYFPRLKDRHNRLAGYLSGGEQQMLAVGRSLVAEPDLIMLDEPSLGLAPLLVEEIFEIIVRINQEHGTSMLLVEQNAALALAISSYGYILENGKVVIDGTSDSLMQNEDVQEFYLGASGDDGENKSYREIKHYKRRKRWLS
jgi:branched-chain amino acid transport system ATP-binding protein